MQKTFDSKIDYLPKLKLHHVTVSNKILKEFAGEEAKSIYNQRFIITINNEITWRGETVSLGNNTAYITLSKERMKSLGAHLGDTVQITLELDKSKYGFDVPEEFEELLRQDDQANALFHALRMGLQRAIIYRVIQYKSSDKRLEKSLFFLENLKKSPKGETTMRHIIGKDLP